MNDLVELALASLKNNHNDIVTQWGNPIGSPTRHFVVDDFFPKDVAELAFNAFPSDGSGFISRQTFREKKRTSKSLSDYNPMLGDITFALQNERVVQLIGALTGIEGLEPDADLSRGGLSMMFRGDYLNPHIDNSHDSQRDRYRRLNILYYVTPDWNLDCGGNFELWDESRKFPKTIVAGNNKLIVMETNRSSWHSVNRVRVDRVRCCISNYYYSKSSPDGDDYYHVTSFDGRPNQGLRSYISRADNYTRGLISKITGKSRG